MQALHAEDKIQTPCQSIEMGSVHAKVYLKAGLLATLTPQDRSRFCPKSVVNVRREI